MVQGFSVHRILENGHRVVALDRDHSCEEIFKQEVTFFLIALTVPFDLAFRKILGREGFCSDYKNYLLTCIFLSMDGKVLSSGASYNFQTLFHVNSV